MAIDSRSGRGYPSHVKPLRVPRRAPKGREGRGDACGRRPRRDLVLPFCYAQTRGSRVTSSRSERHRHRARRGSVFQSRSRLRGLLRGLFQGLLRGLLRDTASRRPHRPSHSPRCLSELIWQARVTVHLHARGGCRARRWVAAERGSRGCRTQIAGVYARTRDRTRLGVWTGSQRVRQGQRSFVAIYGRDGHDLARVRQRCTLTSRPLATASDGEGWRTMADDGGLSAFTIYVRDLCSRSVLDDLCRSPSSVNF